VFGENSIKTRSASIRELHQQLIRKERSAVEITQETLNRITQLEPKLHSFLCVTADTALSQARAVDAKIARGRNRSLAGIPIGIKTICVRKNSYNLRLTHAGELCAAL